MSMIALKPPDERALWADLEAAPFALGVDEGKWRVEMIDWPILILCVSAAERDQAPSEFVLRCDLTGYPVAAPTATPWHPLEARRLAANERPTGTRVGFVFRTDWKEGDALYAPFDRVALSDHQNWVGEHPLFAWTPERGIAWYASRLYELLNDDDYQGV